MNVSAVQNEMARLSVWFFAVELIVLIVALFLLYLVIKSAVRDGIKESGLVDAMWAMKPPPEKTALPPMKAER